MNKTPFGPSPDLACLNTWTQSNPQHLQAQQIGNNKPAQILVVIIPK